MSPVGWLVRRSVDVPDGDWWLSEAECRLQARFVVPKRLADWRLGRWTAKAALAAMLEVDHRRVAVAVAPDGAPEALLDDAARCRCRCRSAIATEPVSQPWAGAAPSWGSTWS